MVDPIDFGPMLERASELVNTLWPLFSPVFIWLGIGLAAWIIGALFMGMFVYDDFATGFHDGHNVIFLGPIALFIVIYFIIQGIRDSRKSKEQLISDAVALYNNLSPDNQKKAVDFADSLLQEQERDHDNRS